MKRLLLLPLLVLCLSGCMMEELDKESPAQEAKEYLVPIKMAGEILEIEEGPLTKAGENNDLYGFQINSKKAGETSYSPYAYGLFDDISNVKIKLREGYVYQFICSMVKNGKEKVYSKYETYYYPYDMPLNNGFTYDISSCKGNLRVGMTYVFSGSNFASYSIPNIDRYHGEISNITPSATSPVSINMLRVVLGFKCVVEGLKEGKLKISLGSYSGKSSSPLIYINTGEAQVFEDIYTFHSFSDDGDNEYLKANYYLNVVHEHSDGTKEVIVNKEVQFNRNKKTTVTIKVNSNDVTGDQLAEAGVGIVIDDTPMTDGDKVVIDGK